MRQLTVGGLELPTQVPGGRVYIASERLHVQRLRVLPVDPVADAAQPREIVPPPIAEPDPSALVRSGNQWPVRLGRR
ncbi:hypothetical protein ACWDBW_47115 [Streptomyces sp. NPDC001107]